ncbi:MAG TPA: tetratricopeptide repeat protein [Kofleriaceae bacterium]|nr:tetratricopeptide repeat protein [Kofleriaceae bacterium]
MRAVLIALALGLVAPATLDAAPGPRGAAPPRPDARPRAPSPGDARPGDTSPGDARPTELVQKEADRHFKSGVALYREAKYADALAEFERAYEIAPHPLVLFNIAECQRELLHYAEAVAAYRRFLADAKDRVPAARLSTAQNELDTLLTLVARLTVTITPPLPDATLLLDGTQLDQPAMPLILPPGEHRLVARATGRRDAIRTVQLRAGDSATVELALAELPPQRIIEVRQVPVARAERAASLALDAGFGMNLRRLGKTGAPSLGLGAAIGSRLGIGVDFVLVAYAVVPSVRVRVIGDALSLHVVGAVPIAFPGDDMSGTFVTMAGGLAVRYRPMPRVAFRLESYVSFGGKDQDTAVPTFLGGELWF